MSLFHRPGLPPMTAASSITVPQSSSDLTELRSSRDARSPLAWHLLLVTFLLLLVRHLLLVTFLLLLVRHLLLVTFLLLLVRHLLLVTFLY